MSDRINDKQSKKDDEAKSALRRRKGESDKGEAVDKLTKQIDKLKVDKKEAKANQISNPLHWFGILVPPSLRSAQKEFENG